ncbi:MAG: hypothetical protein NTW58_13095, partial [Actinobacteria bacterium]|nr:hypothetical protein [Actinomycetota bacterium]
MQQTKRRSKKGVILLALALALFVLVIVPAVALATPGQVTIDNGPKISDKNITITYKSASDPADPGIAFVWIQDRCQNGGIGPWSAWSPAVPVYTPYLVPGASVQQAYTLTSKALPQLNDIFQVRVAF